jgi:D-glycero-D-manno-heptose 1,7-bisphosphate phosphatase
MNSSNKCVFLDRDGVINKEVGDYIKRLEDFEILPHVIPGLKILTQAGYKLIIITNQGGIAKGLYTQAEMNKMHHYLTKELSAYGVEFADIYFCPHHPEKSNCLCRKPDSIMVEKALSKHRINPSLSYFIGDKERDIVCGQKVGVAGILIESNENWIPLVQKIILKQGL